VNRIVLRVNDRIVTLFDYHERLASRRAMIQRSRLAPEAQEKAQEEAPADTLRDLMDEALLMSRGDQISATVDDDRLDRAEQSAKKNFGIENDEQYGEALRQSGMTREQFRNQVRDQMLYQEVLGREVMQTIDVSEEDLLRYYRDHADEFSEPAAVKLREVVVLDREGVQKSERDTLARAVLARLAGGEKLEAVVAELQPLGQTSGVIDLGWVPVQDLDKALASGIEGVAAGQRSGAIEGRGGAHLVEVLERREARLKPYSEIKDRLESAEKQRRYDDELPGYLAKLERAAYVVADPPTEAVNFRRAQPAEPELPEFLALPPVEPADPSVPAGSPRPAGR
jgi:peptidyl-prolyl cis-trans isomerase SurA